MGRRKIEIKAIKDDRNRSVTFLKRKGGLFKKAHELSVLCSVDVAVFIFGSNKKLYEYSSCDMRDLINRYAYHGGPNEHKGPSDFNGGADDDEDEDDNGTPPQQEGLDPHMLPPQFAGQPFAQIRHHTPSASPPIPNGMFGQHPGHQIPRGHTPQPQIGSRPSSRNDIRRMGPAMVPQPVGPPGPPQSHPHPGNGYAYMPQPPMYQPQSQPPMPPNGVHPGMPPVHPQYYGPQPQPHPQQLHVYAEEPRRASVPPQFPQGPQIPPPPPPPPQPRHSASPPQTHQLPPQTVHHMSPPPPQVHIHPMQSPPQPHQQQVPPPQPQEPPRAQPPQEYQLPALVEPKTEPATKPEAAQRLRQPPLLDTGVKRQAKASIFTPIDENRSILSQHLAAFQPDVKSEASASRSHSTDVANVKSSNTTSPPSQLRNSSLASVPETTFTAPSRSNSLQVGTPAGARPRLKVQIPDESDAGSVTADSSSPRGTATDAGSQSSRRPPDSHSSGAVLPPPSPSASALLSAGASGPPNPFARPPPQHQNTNMNIDTPVSALPSRFLNGEFLPSPSSFYPEWNFRGAESNTLPSPLNFATPVAGNGPSFLREDPIPHKRKSPEISTSGPVHEAIDAGNEPKRIKVDS